MLDLFWQRLLPYQMTRIQEPDLLIDHDSGGGGGCKRFLGRPTVESFAYSGIGHGHGSGSQKLNPGAARWFPFSSLNSARSSMLPAPSAYSNRTSAPCSKGDVVSSPSSSTEENPIIVVHNNNNSLDILDENTRWSSSSQKTSHFPSCTSKMSALPPLPPIVLHPYSTATSGGEHGIKSSVIRSSKVKSKSKTSHSKNSMKNNKDSNKNSCNNSSTSNIKLPGVATPCINNCGPGSDPSVAPSPCLTSATRPHPSRPNCGSDDEDSSGQHLLIRYIHCTERPNKKQLMTLGLISVVFLIVLVILLALFLSPSSARNFVSSTSVKDVGSDAFISSDITSNLNIDEADLDGSDSYEDERGETQLYSSSTSSSNTSPSLDMKKVSKLSWDLLNSNQDASSRGSGSNIGVGGSSGGRLSPLGVTSNGEGEIILPAKMIYTSSGDSTDLMPSHSGTGDGGPQNKKRSCCRTQKYSQIIKREGCEPLTIVNKMCFGQCVSVWVPGLFASFPVCRPSKSTFKTVTLTCGRNGEKRKRVRIEKVRRCSCMEIEPTAASL